MSRAEEMFKASRNSVSSNRVEGNDVKSTGRTRYSDTIITVIDISRSVTKGGSGVMSAITIASTAMGTAISPSMVSGTACFHWNPASGAAPAAAAALPLGPGTPPGLAMALAGVIVLTWEPSVHQLENVGQDFGHRAVEMRRNLLAHLHRLVEGLRQGRVLDDGNLVFHGLLADAQGQVVLAF